MQGRERAITADEQPIFFDAEGETLFGILTEPVGPPRDVGFLMLCGGAVPISPNRNRQSVYLCRRLAALGFTSFRFDYHGAGESTGVVQRIQLGMTHNADVLSAAQVLRERGGVSRIVVAGSCSGARSALAAVKDIPDLASLLLTAMPLRDYGSKHRAHVRAAREWRLGQFLRRAFRPHTIRGYFDRRSRRIYGAFAREKLRAMRNRQPVAPIGSSEDADLVMSQSVLADLSGIVDRKIPTLLVYGDLDEYYRDVVAGRSGKFGKILERGAGSMELMVIPGEVHGFHSLPMQVELRRIMYGWLEDMIAHGWSLENARAVSSAEPA